MATEPPPVVYARKSIPVLPDVEDNPTTELKLAPLTSVQFQVSNDLPPANILNGEAAPDVEIGSTILNAALTAQIVSSGVALAQAQAKIVVAGESLKGVGRDQKAKKQPHGGGRDKSNAVERKEVSAQPIKKRGIYTCVSCEQPFMDRESLSAHSCSFHCKFCLKVFGTEAVLAAHEGLHDLAQEPFQCKTCRKTFLLSNDWTSHSKTCQAAPPSQQTSRGRKSSVVGGKKVVTQVSSVNKMGQRGLPIKKRGRPTKFPAQTKTNTPGKLQKEDNKDPTSNLDKTDLLKSEPITAPMSPQLAMANGLNFKEENREIMEQSATPLTKIESDDNSSTASASRSKRVRNPPKWMTEDMVMDFDGPLTANGRNNRVSTPVRKSTDTFETSDNNKPPSAKQAKRADASTMLSNGSKTPASVKVDSTSSSSKSSPGRKSRGTTGKDSPLTPKPTSISNDSVGADKQTQPKDNAPKAANKAVASPKIHEGTLESKNTRAQKPPALIPVKDLQQKQTETKNAIVSQSQVSLRRSSAANFLKQALQILPNKAEKTETAKQLNNNAEKKPEEPKAPALQVCDKDINSSKNEKKIENPPLLKPETNDKQPSLNGPLVMMPKSEVNIEEEKINPSQTHKVVESEAEDAASKIPHNDDSSKKAKTQSPIKESKPDIGQTASPIAPGPNTRKRKLEEQLSKSEDAGKETLVNGVGEIHEVSKRLRPSTSSASSTGLNISPSKQPVVELNKISQTGVQEIRSSRRLNNTPNNNAAKISHVNVKTNGLGTVLQPAKTATFAGMPKLLNQIGVPPTENAASDMSSDDEDPASLTSSTGAKNSPQQPYIKDSVIQFLSNKISNRNMLRMREELMALKRSGNYFKLTKTAPLAAGLVHDMFLNFSS